MEANVWVITLVTVLILFFLLRKLSGKGASDEKKSEWPPGPAKLPFMGNLHQLAKGGDLVHHTLAKLAHAHGRIMTVWVGWQPMIVVSDAELAWEVLVNKSSDYADRFIPLIMGPVTANKRTVVSADTGSHWHALRRGLQRGPLGPVNISAQFYFQERDFELMIHSMVEKAQEDNGVVKPMGLIRRATIRLLSRLCFGSDFAADEAFVDGMDRVVEEVLAFSGFGSLAATFAFARFIPFLSRAFVEAEAAKLSIVALLRPKLTRPASTNSYLQVLLDQNQPEDVAIMALFEVFLLGLDSSASTAVWTLAFLIHHQDVQERLYQEVIAYAGDKMVRAEEVAKMSYLQAVVKETMRMKPIAPLAVPHKTARDTTLSGRRVAKGTQVVVNIYAVHYDQKTWPEPLQFKPERFLTKGNGDGGVEVHCFLPFGGGMRACAGMEIGKLQVSLVVANLVKAFKWLPETEGRLPDLSEKTAFVLMMKTPLAARIIPRVVGGRYV